MYLIPDDPIISSIQRTGYPYWMDEDPDPYGEEDDDEIDED